MTRYIPFVKDVYSAQDYTLIFSLLSISVSARITLPDAIFHSADVINNDALRRKFKAVAFGVRDGKGMASMLEAEGIDEEIVGEVKAGERTSSLSETFNELYLAYNEKLVETIDTATAFINPIMLVFTAVVLITIYYGVNAPMLTIGTSSGSN
jgi:type II secretory pathway component PulF